MSDQNPSKDATPFSGRARTRVTRPGVRLSNSAARLIITFGGIATILAVSLVCVFLVWVVVPLFLPPNVEPAGRFPAPVASSNNGVYRIQLNEYLTMGWLLTKDGQLRVFRLDTGEQLDEYNPFDGAVPTAAAFGGENGAVAFGFADGTVRYGTFAFTTDFLDADSLPPEVRALAPGESQIYRDGIVEVTPEGQFRSQSVEVSLEDPVLIDEGRPIALLDISIGRRGPTIAALSGSNRLHVKEITRRRNLLTNEVTTKLKGGSLQLDIPAGEAAPEWLKLSGLGDNVYLIWHDGRLLRYDTRDGNNPVFAESILVAAEPDVDVTAVDFEIGKTSLVTGDTAGRVRVWFRINAEEEPTPDGTVLVMGHELPAADVAIHALAVSERTRLIAAGYADGAIRLMHVTSENVLADVAVDAADGSGVQAVALGPKDDALLGFSDGEMRLWDVDAPHPETTLRSIFTPVWYEGYDAPAQVWQSSSATDDFEPKYGLYPLIFGTVKATVYSMLFGVPAALLAAIYTSEMMQARLRMRIKPVIELMASLPSVVLGFLAALVVAPLIEDIVPEVLSCLATVPFAILLGAYLWQLLPRRFATRNQKFRILFITAMLGVGVALGFAVGPVVELLLFAGDIKRWLDGQIGSGAGAWMFAVLPATAVLAAVVSGRVFTPLMHRISAGWTEFQVALAELVRFVVLTAATLLVAGGISYLLADGPVGVWNFDPRGTFVDTYVQRNALVVGVIMGFAIIPIIYTISEDALSAVPEHLRTASLGAGATPWQTAVRIIIPTAASGLFSAIMIGFGRAVGETMIVLMAAGNTPLMDWNIFNGFRTLSANIAVELPEAVKDSTHYRMLFLAALTLFIMTFAVNTAAEVVRQRFRKRAFEV